MLRVLLISANREHFPEPVFPLGTVYVASALVRQGMSVRIFDAGTSSFPLPSLHREIKAWQPHLIGLSLRNIDNAAYPCTRHYVDWYRKIVAVVRRKSSAPLFLGGSAFAIFPEELLRLLKAEGGVVGDGEEGMVRLCREERDGYVKGREHGSSECTVLETNIDDPARIEFPREIDGIFPSFGKYRTIGIQTARGCPHHCIYCTYPLLEGKGIRSRPAETVADELEFLCSVHGKRDFFIVDSSFNADERHMEEVCRALISRKMPVRFSCYLTPKMADASLFKLLSEAGCVAVDFGTDSCSEKILGSLRKGFTVRDVKEASDACRKAGIDFCHSLIFGGPGESPETARETVKWMDELRPKAVVAMTGVRIYPHTEMERIALKEGFISRGEDLLRPRFYFHGEGDGLLRTITAIASARRNWFLPGGRDWSSALGPRILRLFHRAGPLWRTFREE
jgi:radical SAM superfamily enzyme YgiQ (UPF0313 family)